MKIPPEMNRKFKFINYRLPALSSWNFCGISPVSSTTASRPTITSVLPQSYKPVLSEVNLSEHGVTTEQMAWLEPTLVESVLEPHSTSSKRVRRSS